MINKTNSDLQNSRSDAGLQCVFDTFSQSYDSCIVTDASGQILFVNTSARNLLGHGDSELVGKDFSTLIDADAREATSSYLQRLAESGEPMQFESAGLHKDGKVLHLSISATPLLKASAGRSLVFLNLRDCTPMELMRNRLAEVSFKLGAIIGCSPSALSLKRPNGEYALANPNLQNIHGLTEEQIVGKTDFDLYTESVARAFAENDAHVLKTRSKQSIEEQMPIDGVLRTYMSHMFPIFDEQGEIRFICRISLDISDKKASDAEVFKLVQAIEQSPFPILITDSRRRIEFVNQAFTETTGYSREEAIGQTPSLLKSGRTPAGTYIDMNESLKKKSTWKGEFCNQRKNGSTYIDSVVISPLTGADGKVSHYVSIRQDITESKKNELELQIYQSKLEDLVSARTQELSEAKALAEQANSAKSNFLATISHEIRNPLGGILGISELLSLQTLSAEAAELVTLQKSAISQLTGLLNNVLDYSKIEAGMFEFESHSFVLGELINNIANLKRIRCAQKGLEFHVFSESPKDKKYIGDPIRIRQIIQNLLSNAYKYTKKGSITLSVKTTPWNESCDMVTISVKDTGLGMSREDQANLFQPFVQAEQDNKLKAQGTGLGLSIVRKLATMMNGGAEVESELGRGSTFTIRFQLQRAMSGNSEYKPTSSIELKRKLKILIADDDSLTRKIMLKLLRNHGHEVLEAVDGESALLSLSKQAFDVVITDFSMPDMTGADLLLHAKAVMKAGCETKFICLSGHTQFDFIESLNRVGFDAYFSKPLNLDLLEHKLQQYA